MLAAAAATRSLAQYLRRCGRAAGSRVYLTQRAFRDHCSAYGLRDRARSRLLRCLTNGQCHGTGGVVSRSQRGGRAACCCAGATGPLTISEARTLTRVVLSQALHIKHALDGLRPRERWARLRSATNVLVDARAAMLADMGDRGGPLDVDTFESQLRRGGVLLDKVRFGSQGWRFVTQNSGDGPEPTSSSDDQRRGTQSDSVSRGGQLTLRLAAPIAAATSTSQPRRRRKSRRATTPVAHLDPQ